MNEVTVTCLCGFDPRLVNIAIALPTGGSYNFQVPESYYQTIAGPLGYPSDPCEDC